MCLYEVNYGLWDLISSSLHMTNCALGMSFVGRVSKKGALMYLIAALPVETIHNPVPTHVGGS